jgi:YesN/AraC family two-component response regulator
MMFRIYNVISNAHGYLGDHKTRLYWTTRALEQAQQLGDTLAQAEFHVTIAGVYSRLDDTAQAIAHFNRALELYRNPEDKLHIIRTLNNKALVFDPSSAEKLDALRKAAQLAESAAPPTAQILTSLAHIYCNIGNWYARVERHDRAILYYDKAVQTAQKSGNRHLKIFLYSHLAQYHFDQSNRQKAKQFAEDALEIIYAAVGTNHTYDVALRLLSQLYADEGDFRRAFQMMQQWSAVNDSLQARNTREELNRINSRFLFESHRQEQLITQQRIAERNRTYFVFALILSLLIFVSWMFHSRQMTKKNRGLYRQIKEQDRLAEELEQLTNHYNDLSIAGRKADSDDVEDKYETAQQQDESIGKQTELVVRLRNYFIDNQITTFDIDSAELATKLATNRTYLFEAVKTVTGKPLQEYIKNLRIENARHLLDTTNESIEIIAEMSGYNTSRTFYRQFRERYGISPMEYRKFGVRE